MTYKLFIDDERYPVDPCRWIVKRSSNEVIFAVKHYGVPSFISFDHDLGGDDTSMTFLRWFIDYLLDNDLDFPEYYVHSQNPVGKQNIEGLIQSFIKFKEK